MARIMKLPAIILALVLAIPSLCWGRDIAYVLFGGDGNSQVRLITRESSCPDIRFDGKSEKMAARAKPGDARAAQFPVLTCEAEIPRGTQHILAGDIRLAAPHSEISRIVVLGDTGCRMKGHAFQSCSDPQKWPFEQISAAAAAFKPDLVIHVGDYHYRESPCPQGIKGCAGSPYGYGFDVWNADFFAPAAKLLQTAPWVFVRGNHESCFRAGQGWFRFLAWEPFTPERSCQEPANDSIADYSAPYSVPISSDTQLIIFDSSRSPDISDTHYQSQFETVNKLAKAFPHSFFLSHHPVLGFAEWKSRIYPGNAALQSSMHEVNRNRLFPPGVDAAFHGHVHLFEALNFGGDYPTTFVTGNSGTATDTALPQELPAGSEPFPGAIVKTFFSSASAGFVTLERTGTSWRLTERDRFGTPQLVCTLLDRTSVCMKQ